MRTLRLLADWLERMPDVDIEDLPILELDRESRSHALAVNVATLAALSRVNRTEWIHFIKEHGFPIELRPRDASRDVLGKLLKFLEEEPSAIEYLRNRVQHSTGTSPEVTRALRALLSYRG